MRLNGRIFLPLPPAGGMLRSWACRATTRPYEWFILGVFDKTENFKFHVVKYPSIHSNVPDNLLYHVFYSQIIRILSICTCKDTFLPWFCKIVTKCVTKGAKPYPLCQKIKQLQRNYQLTKTDCSYTELCNNIHCIYAKQN